MLKENTEQTETIPIVDVEEPLALPPPPPPEDEWRPVPEHTNVDGKVDIPDFIHLRSLFVIFRYIFHFMFLYLLLFGNFKI